MNNDWLKQLAPAHAPPPPGWWPPAPGWWIVAGLVLLAAGWLIYRYRRPASRLRRLAMNEFKKLETGQIDDVQLAKELEHLMRRYALAAYGHQAVAGLSGESWLTFITGHGGGILAGEAGQGLIRAAYGGAAQADRSRWLEGVRGFLRGRP
jgi:hypothetical protein